jgi:hypothetical protein
MGHHQNEGPSETGGRSLASRCLLLPRFWAVAYGKSSWSSAEEKHLQACERCRRYAERVTREAQASVLRAFFRDKVLVDPGDLPLADRDWAARTLTEPGMGYLCLTFIPGLCPGELWVAMMNVRSDRIAPPFMLRGHCGRSSRRSWQEMLDTRWS